MLDPTDAKTTLLYYSGGDGPHSGGGKEHGRANWMARATAPTDGLAGLAPTEKGGVGTLRTHPITVHSSRLRLRIAGGAEASVGVRVESEAGALLLEGLGVLALEPGHYPCSKPAYHTAKTAFSAGFHTASLNWTAGKVEVGLDGVVVNTITSPCLVEQIKMDFDRETMPGWMELPDPR